MNAGLLGSVNLTPHSAELMSKPAPLNAIKLRPDLTPDPFPKGRGDLIPLYSLFPLGRGAGFDMSSAEWGSGCFIP